MSEIEKKNEAEAVESRTTSLESGESNIKEGALLRKLDLHLLPAVSVLYLLSFLDRSNVGNAKIEGLTDDVHMTTNQYLTGLTLFFVGYILFEVPFNIILKRTTPKFWLPTVTVVWGIVATLFGIIQNLAGFDTARFFLGVAEGGLFPGVVWYLSMWYKRQERQFRIALFFSAASLAGAFGGILAYGISKMNGIGGLEGWRWIFILEGIATVLIASLAYLFISNWPSTARWLDAEEKAFIYKRLKADSDATNNEGFKWSNVMDAMKDPKVWIYCAAFHTCSLPLYTLSLFLPTIILGLGFEAASAQLLTVPPYALATILTFTLATISERMQKRAPFIILADILAIIGYIMLLANPLRAADDDTVILGDAWVSYAGLFLAAAGIYPATAISLSWPAVNVSGQTKRAVAGAMQITIGNLGAVIGTQLYRENDTPRFFVGHGVALAYMVGNAGVSALAWWYLGRENKRREALIGPTEGMKTPGEEEEWAGDVDPRWRFQR